MRSDSLSRQLASLIALGIVFLAVSYLAARYRTELAVVALGGGIPGVVGFVLLTALFVIFVIPLDIAFLIPVGASVFGPIPTALMSIAGWTLGAAAAFGIARQWGRPVVERLIGLERVHMVEKRIPKRNLFWSVVALRLLVSVDILSYALGLMSDMSLASYVTATAIGVAPFGFYFSYTSSLPFFYRIAATLLAVGIAGFALMRYGFAREP